jgi:hypothetical protein
MKRIKNFSDYMGKIEKLENINSGRSFYMEGQDVSKLASDIIKFMKDEDGIVFDKAPEIFFSRAKHEEHFPVFRETGSYSPDINQIVIYTDGRSLKDCLRSLTHELIHADQKLNKGMDIEKAAEGIYKKSKGSEKIEADAYKRGNLIFRKWEEYLRNKLKNIS